MCADRLWFSRLAESCHYLKNLEGRLDFRPGTCLGGSCVLQMNPSCRGLSSEFQPNGYWDRLEEVVDFWKIGISPCRHRSFDLQCTKIDRL